MIFIILATLLLLGIAFAQQAQGFYSAMIMAVLTVLSAAFAFTFYEPMAEHLYSVQPTYADAISLVGLMVVPLLGMRLLLDRFFRANVVTGVWMGRIGGGIMGLITGMVLVGVLSVAVQMLPLGSTVLGYTPYDDSLQPDDTLVPFKPDRFVIGLIDLLSEGSLKADPVNGYPAVHDNLPLELFCARNRMEGAPPPPVLGAPSAGVAVAPRAGGLQAKPDCLTVSGAYLIDPPPKGNTDANLFWRLDSNLPRDPLMDQNMVPKVIVIRIVVDDTARDSDNWWRLAATHFRLIARKLDGTVMSHYPVGYLTAQEQARIPTKDQPNVWPAPWVAFTAPIDDKTRLAQVARFGVQRTGVGKITVDWIYCIEMEETPETMVFRRVAHCAVPLLQKSLPPEKDSLARVAPMPVKK